MTKRLRELEEVARVAKLSAYMPGNTLPGTATARVEGYRMALEDLKPVLEAARWVNDPMLADEYCFPVHDVDHPCWIEKLREALEGLDIWG